MKLISVTDFVGLVLLATVATASIVSSDKLLRRTHEYRNIIGSGNFSNVTVENANHGKIIPSLSDLNLTRHAVKTPHKVPLNWDKDVPIYRRVFINQAYDDAIALAKAGSKNTIPGKPVFDRYLTSTDARYVKAVFEKFVVMATDDSERSQIGDVIIAIGDPDAKSHWCVNPKPPVAWAQPPKGSDGSWYGKGTSIRICKGFFDAPQLNSFDCSSVAKNWDKVNWGMASTGAHFLHEWMHYSETTYDLNGQMHILDQKVSTGPKESSLAYGPYLAAQYRLRPVQAPRDNADNLVWFAIESYWTQECPEHSFKPAPEDSYVYRDPTDEPIPVGPHDHH